MEKVIYIDVGNTHIVCAYNNKIYRFKTSENIALFQTFPTITHIAMVSVVKCVTKKINAFAKDNNISIQSIDHYSKIGFDMDVQHPETVGLDRLMNLRGARDLYKGALLVIDSGTAITFDILSSKNTFMGGVIGAGMMMQRNALSDYTDALPMVDITHDVTVIGNHTVPSLQSGIFWGHIAQIEGLVARIKMEYNEELTVIGTGGIMDICKDHVKYIDYFHKDLIIRGLKSLS